MLVLSKYVLRGFSAENGNAARTDIVRSFLRRHNLLDEVTPAERAFLLDGADPTDARIVSSTWRSEALVALSWAIRKRDTLDFGGQVSLGQAVPDLGDDDAIRALLAAPPLRDEDELRRALELWFVVHWRLQLRLHGVDRFDLAGWVAASPHLRALTPDDLPLIEGDLSLDAYVMKSAASDLSLDDELPVDADRVPISVCTGGMLSAGENVLRIVTERLRVFQWLFGVIDTFDQEPLGLYRPDTPAARDKQALYGADETASVDGYDACGGLALHRAAWRGDVATMRDLIKAGADVLSADIDGDLVLHCAVHGGHREAVEALLSDDPMLYHFEDADGRKAIHLAAGSGDLDMLDAVTAVLDGSDGSIEVADDRGDTALEHAVRHGQEAAVDRLVEMGASLDGSLAVAIRYGRADMLAPLAGHGVEIDRIDRGTTPMYRAAFHGQSDCAVALVDLGADATFTHESGTTALHAAANTGATELCLRLLDRGADLNTRLDTMRAVHFAFLGGHTDCALALLDRGADVTGCEYPLIDLALRGGSVPLIQWCLDRGERDPEAAWVCAKQGWADALSAVIATGEPVDAVNEEGLTALHLAAMYGNDDCVRLLLAAGASRQTGDNDGRTPFDWAAHRGHDTCAALLAGR